MSDPGSYPPPGQPAAPAGPPVYPAYPTSPAYPSVPPGYAQPPPGYAQPGYPTPPPYPAPPSWPAPPGHPQAGYLPMAPAHKPGAIPLRPLGLGDIFDGAFKIIRFNPKATIGSAVLVSAASMLIPIVVTVILSLTVNLSATTSDGVTTVGDNVGAGAIGVGFFLQWIGLIFVTGMVIHVAAAAAVGRRLSLGEAWAGTRGKRWKLVGMTLFLLLVTLLIVAITVGLILLYLAVVSGAAGALVAIAIAAVGIAVMTFFWVRVYYLGVPPLMLEPVGVFGALKRSWSLTSRQFWRILGIALLTLLSAQIASGMVGFPFQLAGSIAQTATNGDRTGVLLYVGFTAVATVVSSAIVAPFNGAVVSLQYIDQRIRKEGYDVELMTRAGITGP